jgi:hypothetical protein
MTLSTYPRTYLWPALLLACLCAPPAPAADPNAGLGTVGAPDRLGVACWFWQAAEFEPEGYKPFLDVHATHAACRLLTTSIRHDVEVTDPAVRDQIAAAVEYARERGMGIALDLDVRLARAAFQARYPEEMQEIVRLREVSLAGDDEVRLRTESISLGDHYTFRARPYDPIAGRVLSVYTYARTPEGIAPDSLVDVTERCTVVEASKDAVEVVIPREPGNENTTACVLSAFTLFTPAVFAPHLVEFERSILETYADIPLAGVCKDEWGFPGRFNPDTTDLWFSRYMADAYAARRPGRELTADFLLMAFGMAGREGERAAAINHTMEMQRERNAALEGAFRDNTKAIFGAQAYIGTHPTWFPYPGANEAFKNGLNWWAVPRDVAQTDETTPYSVRTALAKKWGSPTWLNMYYAPTVEAYADDIWRHVLGGGRMNLHPVWPSEWSGLRTSLLEGELQQADGRIRMLDFIATAPIACPVAVFFGHPAFLNWADDTFADAGLEIANALWERGIYADLIPTSEIASGAVRVAEDGRIAYGPQHYAAAVLYHPQYERAVMAGFFQNAADAGKTALFRVGDWTRDFDGEPFDGNAALPAAMSAVDAGKYSLFRAGDGTRDFVCERIDGNAALPAAISALNVDMTVERIAFIIEEAGISLQPRCDARELHGFPPSMVPLRKGTCRLIDGTVILVSGETAVMGDPIQATIEVEGHPVEFDAVGMAAVRLDTQGRVDALAAGGLKRFHGGGLEIALDERRDMALWRDEGGAWQGAIRGTADVPKALAAITPNWQRVYVPAPFEN